MTIQYLTGSHFSFPSFSQLLYYYYCRDEKYVFKQNQDSHNAEKGDLHYPTI